MFVWITFGQIAMMILGTTFTFIWLYFYLRYSKKYDDILSALSKDEFILSDLFFIGFGVMNFIGFDIESAKSKKKIKTIAEVKGETYAKFYYYVITGGKITYTLTFLPVSFFIAALSKEFIFFIFGLVIIIAFIYYLDLTINESVKKRRDELLMDLPQVLSKLTLLLNTGITMRNAWTSVAMTGKGVLYEEMIKTNDDISNGMSELEAYQKFADRCGVKETKKFSSILIQNLQKGNKEVTFFIKEMAEESWELKKQNVKIKSELASSKLLIPIGMMLIAVLMVIIVPIFASL